MEIKTEIKVIGKKLELSKNTIKKALELSIYCRNIKNKKMGLIAALLYLSCKLTDEEITQRQIADYCDVYELTLRNNLNKIWPIIVIQIPTITNIYNHNKK